MKTAIAALTILLAASPTLAQVCGDVNDSGKVTAGDALAVLKTAVGLNVSLICDTGDCLALETRLDSIEDGTLVAKDRNGVVLGRVLSSASGGATIVLGGSDPSTDYLLELTYIDEDESGLPPIVAYPRQPGYPDAYFESLDCSGQALGFFSWQGVNPSWLLPLGGKVFVMSGVKTKPHAIKSRLDADGDCLPENVDFTSLDDANDVMLELKEVALPFTLPSPGPMAFARIR